MALDAELKRTKCVVARKFGESVYVGESKITIQKKKRSQNTFLLVIEAPPDIVILREEISEKYSGQNEPSAVDPC
jgi:sRNA-binding carbon storage regulator CsrA